MNTIHLRIHELRKLKELALEKGTLNTEALMLILNKKHVKNSPEKTLLFKYLDAQDDEKIMGRKIYTVSLLNSSDQYREIDELIIPNTIVIVDNKIAGFAMPLVQNHTNLGIFLNNPNNSFSQKIEYLKQVGRIIDKVQRVTGESFRMNFGDLNEFNFIIDNHSIVRAIDLDSAYIGQDEPATAAYYLLKNDYLKLLSDKYRFSPTGIILPSDETDLYCYNTILLSTLAEEEIYKKSIDIFYKYLFHLKDVGLDIELIKIFSSIYNSNANQNPFALLKTIKPEWKDAMSYQTFKKEYKIKG